MQIITIYFTIVITNVKYQPRGYYTCIYSCNLYFTIRDVAIYIYIS